MSINTTLQFEAKQKFVFLLLGDGFVFYIEQKSIYFSQQLQKYFIQTMKTFLVTLLPDIGIVCRMPVEFFSVTR